MANEPVIIVGRTLENYRGAVPTAGSIILHCMVCGANVVVSQAGHDFWRSRITPETAISGAACNACALALASIHETTMSISSHAKTQADTNPVSAQILDLFRTVSQERKDK